MTDTSDTFATLEAPEEEMEPDPEPITDEELSTLPLIRELVFKANPDVVPELVKGESIVEILASVEQAREAYKRIADGLRKAIANEVPAAESFGTVSTSPTPVADTERLSTSERLRFGLQERNGQPAVSWSGNAEGPMEP